MYKRFLFIIILIIVLMSSCNARGVNWNESSSIIKTENSIYYCNQNIDTGNIMLCRYNMKTEKSEVIAERYYISRLFFISDKIYFIAYDHLNDSADVCCISVNDEKNKIKIMGNLEWFMGNNLTLMDYYDVEIFEYGKDIYVITESNVYRVNNDASEKVAEDIYSIFCKNNKIYYSTVMKICCYNITDSKTEVLWQKGDNATEYINDLLGGNFIAYRLREVNDKLYFSASGLNIGALSYIDLKNNKGICQVDDA